MIATPRALGRRARCHYSISNPPGGTYDGSPFVIRSTVQMTALPNQRPRALACLGGRSRPHASTSDDKPARQTGSHLSRARAGGGRVNATELRRRQDRSSSPARRHATAMARRRTVRATMICPSSVDRRGKRLAKGIFEF